MKKKKLNQVFDIMFISRNALLISSFVFLVGISSGIFLELAMDSAAKENASSFLKRYLFSEEGLMIEYPAPFSSGLRSNIPLLLLMMLSGLISFGFPLAYLVVLYKAMTIGFSAGLLIESFALSGIGSILFLSLPQNIILVPVYITACAVTQNHCLSGGIRRSAYSHDKSRYPVSGNDLYLSAYILLFVGTAIACLVQSIIFPLFRA